MKDKLVESFLEFSEEANKRSTVDLRDGLKPVHRRILYTLSQYKSKEMIGSAKVVGEVLGSFHPHGDKSVYDAAARLAKPFKTRYPLVDFDGNIGTLSEPDGHASQRYTKMKLSPLGALSLAGVDKGAVRMVENYDGELLEPDYLSGVVPITLMNGTLGIGVGMATSIPPHNLKEVAGAIIHRVDNPTSTTKDMMRFIKGPDFPTGCSISNPDDLLQAYETGQGSVKIKADYEVVTVGGKTRIIVKEVPYLVNPMEMIVGKIQEMYNDGYQYIEDVENHTGKNESFKIEITLTKDAPVFEVLEHLLKETSIETHFGINLTVYLGNNRFERINLLGLIDAYIEQNLRSNRLVAEFDLKKLQDRKLIVEGLIIATQQIDEVVRIIKSSEDTASANRSLCEFLNIVEIQARAILSMRLSSLTKLDAYKLKDELDKLIQKISEINEFLNSKELQFNLIKSNIADISKKYGDARKTRIKKDIEIGESQDLTVFLNKSGEIYSTPTDSLDINRRNTKGKVFDDIISFIEVSNKGEFCILDSAGVVTAVSVASIDSSSEMIRNNVSNLGVRGEAVQLFIPKSSKYIVSLTEQGVIKKSLSSDYNMSRPFKVAKIRDEDRAAKVFQVNEGDHFIMILSNMKYVYFNEDEINITGINTIGTKAGVMDILSLDLVDESVLFVGQDGNGKRMLPKSLKSSGRKTNGLSCNDTVFAQSVRGDHVMFWGSDDKMIRLNKSSISTSASTASKGVMLYNGDLVKSLTS